MFNDISDMVCESDQCDELAGYVEDSTKDEEPAFTIWWVTMIVHVITSVNYFGVLERIECTTVTNI